MSNVQHNIIGAHYEYAVEVWYRPVKLRTLDLGSSRHFRCADSVWLIARMLADDALHVTRMLANGALHIARMLASGAWISLTKEVLWRPTSTQGSIS